ncbi:glutathione S-transferase U10-like [Populus nigra]|uniref:glutathione S-transferase U10-like n=1 Tax=Populus nigra TaxID=3691 RepID=UPI002B26D8C7|nr:glutathione S-transferase U10-like [Populus nigra]
MEETDRVTLHGMWASSYSKRVEMALKIKGMPYEDVEEDLRNKSPLLLQPGKIHQGFGPLILIKEPKSAFWVSFIQQQLFESTGKVILSDEEAQEKAVEEVQEKMKVLEEGIKEFSAEDIRTSDGKKLGFMDVLVSTTFSTYKVLEPEKNPLIYTRVTNLHELPVGQELLPRHDKLVAILQACTIDHPWRLWIPAEFQQATNWSPGLGLLSWANHFYALQMKGYLRSRSILCYEDDYGYRDIKHSVSS